jgi:GNAT superfamily N-acetyltransferase
MRKAMGYFRRLKNGIGIATTRPEHADALARLQETVFPTLASEQRFQAAHYRKHVELFPDGQFVALDADRVVGATSTVRLQFDFNHPGHTFADILQGGWLTSHDPEGDWLYGADVGVHPDYRGRGIARALYSARQDTVRRLGLKGQVAGAMISGYGALKDRMSAEEYYRALVQGRLRDPTVSAQMKVGFEPRGLLPNYLDDPVCANYGVLIVLDASRDVPVE